jgi:sugar transferase (PEP-CTERM/EpsH1 system associated)
MNILLLSPYPPYPPHGGGTMRIYQLLRGLAQHHTVTCLTFAADQTAVAAMQPLRAMARLIPVVGVPQRTLVRRALDTLTSPLPDMALRNASVDYSQALEQLVYHEKFDVVQAESIEMAGYLNCVPRPTLRVLDQFNAEFVLQRRAAETALQSLKDLRRAAKSLAGVGYSLVQAAKLKHYERQVMRQSDLVLAVSPDDQAILKRLAPDTPIGVVPNGVDTEHFARQAMTQPLSLAPGTLVFSGTLDFRPNVDAVIWFAQQVLPLVRARQPHARLLVVGKRPHAALRQLDPATGVVVLGEVPDARPYLAAADVYVVPMRIGGGVRLKLLEALALEAPVVSTHIGAEGVVGLTDGQHCLLADSASDMANAVVALLANPQRGRQLGHHGRKLVQTGYDWKQIIPQLEALYEEHYGKRTPTVIA